MKKLIFAFMALATIALVGCKKNSENVDATNTIVVASILPSDIATVKAPLADQENDTEAADMASLYISTMLEAALCIENMEASEITWYDRVLCAGGNFIYDKEQELEAANSADASTYFMELTARAVGRIEYEYVLPTAPASAARAVDRIGYEYVLPTAPASAPKEEDDEWDVAAEYITSGNMHLAEMKTITLSAGQYAQLKSNVEAMRLRASIIIAGLEATSAQNAPAANGRMERVSLVTLGQTLLKDTEYMAAVKQVSNIVEVAEKR